MSTARRGREIFSSEKILVTESLRLQGVMNDYDDEIFWDKLELCLGKRDFLRTITEEEKKQIKKNDGFLPDRIHEIYDRWRDKFEKNGIERLELREDIKK